jgi:NAD(P)-dependent dehydrogenase (short-subunit alcohol dehydrogenase family)
MMIDYMNKFRLDRKIAFVVGGAGLIGSEVTTAFAIAGAKVIVLDINQANGNRLARRLSSNKLDVQFNLFDCTNLEALEHAICELVDKYGCPSVYINCSYPTASEWAHSSFREITLDSFRSNIDIHQTSFSWLARLIANTMEDNSVRGSITQLGSTYGILGQDLTTYEGTEMKENMTYSVIKGGIVNLTRQMASYYGQYGIRINSLCPGGLVGHIAGTKHQQDPLFVRQYSEKTPLKRLGYAEEVASTALFLAADASSYITGSTIVVDGGWSAI